LRLVCRPLIRTVTSRAISSPRRYAARPKLYRRAAPRMCGIGGTGGPGENVNLSHH
jgi:hypothetical protein